MADVTESTIVETEVVSTDSDVAAPAAAESKVEPTWIKARLEQAERATQAKILKELGSTDFAEVKTAMADLAARREAQKTAEQKAAELGARLSSVEQEKATLAEALKGYAASQLEGLTETQREAVVEVAGEDPAAQLKAIKVMSKTWSAKPSAEAPAAKAPVANTSAGRNAPAANGSSTPLPIKSQYAALRETNPWAASRLGDQHPDIYGKK